MESERFSFLAMANSLKVIFKNIPERFVENTAVTCKLDFKDYKVQASDRVAIFPLGWTSLSESLVDKLALPAPLEWIYSFDTWFHLQRSKEEENDQFYQFCYISSDNIVQGVSPPFEIVKKQGTSLSQTESLAKLVQDKDHLIIMLKDENRTLKESLRALIRTQEILLNGSSQKEVEDLSALCNKLKSSVNLQGNEIEKLKVNERFYGKEIEKLRGQIRTQQREIEALKQNSEKAMKKNIDLKEKVEDLVPLPTFPKLE